MKTPTQLERRARKLYALRLVDPRAPQYVLADALMEEARAAREREKAPTKEPVKRHSWVIRVERGGEIDECRYKGTHGPVTAEHVRQSLVVKTWIAGDRLVSICPA